MRLVSSLTGLDSVVSVHTNDCIFSCLVKCHPVKLETSDPSPSSECSLGCVNNRNDQQGISPFQRDENRREYFLRVIVILLRAPGP